MNNGIPRTAKARGKDKKRFRDLQISQLQDHLFCSLMKLVCTAASSIWNASCGKVQGGK